MSISARVLIVLSFLMSLVPGLAQAVLCTDVFSNAVGTTDKKLEIKDDVRLTNTGNRVLATDELEIDDGNNKCDSSACLESGSEAPTLTLPSNSSSNDFSTTGNVSFAPGDHYYDDFKLEDDAVLTVTGSGTVRIHVKNDLSVKDEARINVGGSANRLVFLVGDDVKFEDDARVVALIYAVEKVEMKNDARLTGAIVGAEAKLEDDARIDYVAPSTADFNGVCTYPSGPLTPLAAFGLDEEGLDGTGGELSDAQGNFSGAFALGTSSGVASTSVARICRALDIPANTSQSARWGADTGVDVDDDIGSSGSITFWYRADSDWNSGTQRMLLDASQSGGENAKFFHVSVTADGRVRFYIEDSNETDLMTDTAQMTVSGGTWKHIAVTWDLPSDRYRIYIDGNLAATGTDNSNGTIGELQTLYIGDNRSNYHFGGSDNSAAGVIDEVRIFDSAISAADVYTEFSRSGACPSDDGNIPYAEFRLEEPAGAWNGSAGEVVDNQGVSTTAHAFGTSSGVATIADGKICRAVTIPNNTSGSARYFVDTGVDVDGELGSAGSVTFWYRSDDPWVGGGDRMLFDASEDDHSNAKYFFLMLNDNGQLEFRFEDSSDNDLSVQSSARNVSGSAWVHIGVTWDFPGDEYRLYVDGNRVATGNANSNGTIGTLMTLVFGDNRGDYYPNGTDNSADGDFDELRLYDRVLSDAEVLVDYQNDRTCDQPPAADADGFNCFASGADAIAGSLYLQLVGNAFTFDVAALEDSNADGGMDGVQADFASDADRTLTVELVDASSGGACAALPAISPPVTQGLVFAAADSGRKAAAAMTVSRAYRALRCRVADATPSPAVVACSTDTFGVRPQALSLQSTALDNAGSSGLPMAAAGATFTLTATAGAGYDGTPKIDNALLSAHTGAVQLGTLAGAFATADPTTGSATGTAFTYSEVGNFRFAAQGLYDDGFAASDAATGDCSDDFSNTAVAGRYGCKFGNSAASDWIGRFHPAAFTVSKLADGALAENCAIGGFSYQGLEVAQSTPLEFRVTAVNSGGTVTRNYTAGYARLAVDDFTFDGISGDASQPGADGVTAVTAAWTTAGSRTLDDNADGTHDLQLSAAGFTWGRASNDIVAPFTTDLDIRLSAVVDADGVSAGGLPLTADPAGVDMRYARIALGNAHGSELQHLAVPMRAEYFAGTTSGFVVNSADACASVSSLIVSDLNAADALTPGDTCIWDADDDSGFGCSGSGPMGMEFEPVAVSGVYEVSLKAPGAAKVGVLGVTAAAPPHLQFDWSGSGDSDPVSRVTFGIFNRPSSIIYRREVR